MAASFSEDDLESLLAEIEALKSIYLDELDIKEDGNDHFPDSIRITLYPATAEKVEEQYVCLTLIIKIPKKYPMKSPKVEIKNPRGLSDSQLEKIYKNICSMSAEGLGGPVLYQMIEAAKDFLTESNIPTEDCTICLLGFTENDVFTKTECYHYFHCHCLARFVKHSLEEISDEDLKGEKREVLCPVCRIQLHDILDLTKEYPQPEMSTGAENVILTAEVRKLQRMMQELYMKQKRKGGIIDIERERNRYLLEIAEPASSENPPESMKILGRDLSTVQTGGVVDPLVLESEMQASGLNERRPKSARTHYQNSGHTRGYRTHNFRGRR